MTTVATNPSRFTLKGCGLFLGYFEVVDGKTGQTVETVEGELWANRAVRKWNLRAADAPGMAQTVIADVKALIAGDAPFSTLTVEERAEQLQNILGAIESAPSLLFPALKKQSDQTIIGIVSDDGCPYPMRFEAVAELTRRLAAPAPTERDEIEQRCASIDQQQPDPFEMQ